MLQRKGFVIRTLHSLKLGSIKKNSVDGEHYAAKNTRKMFEPIDWYVRIEDISSKT
jgi:hypothetical protein